MSSNDVKSVMPSPRKPSFDMGVLDQDQAIDFLSPDSSLEISKRKGSDVSSLLSATRKDSDAIASLNNGILGEHSTSLRKQSDDASRISTLSATALFENNRKDTESISSPLRTSDVAYQLNLSLTGVSVLDQNSSLDISAITNTTNGRLRKESDASAISTLVNLRKNSDASTSITSAVRLDDSLLRTRKDSMDMSIANDEFLNLRKLSDASAVTLENLRKDSDTADATGVASTNDCNRGLHEKNIIEPKSVFAKTKIKFESDEAGDIKDTTILTRSALDHLDALGPEKHREDDDRSASTVTFAEGHDKILVDALLGGRYRRDRAESWGAMSDISLNAVARAKTIASSIDISNISRAHSPTMNPMSSNHSQNIDLLLSPRSTHSFHSLHGGHSLHGARNDQEAEVSFSEHDAGIPFSDLRSQSSASKLKQSGDPDEGVPGKIRVPGKIAVPKSEIIGQDALTGSQPRDRLDSLSSQFVFDRKDSITSHKPRERLESLSAMSFGMGGFKRERLDSLANMSGIFSKGRDRLDSLASLGEVSMNMSLGDIVDVAGRLENVVHQTDEVYDSDAVSNATGKASGTNSGKKSSVPPPYIQVDSEAVKEAVKAAMSVTVDLMNIGSTKSPSTANSKSQTNIKAESIIGSSSKPLLPKSARNEALVARARAAAGYVHPANGGSMPTPSTKKRPLPNASYPSNKKPVIPHSVLSTPQNARFNKAPSGVHIYSEYNSTVTPKRRNFGSATKSTPGSTTSKGGQSSQKWDEMFECLEVFVQEQREKETKNMSEEDKSRWEWSGNVPTTYKTKSGKALGRWINNQRSAKVKGTLKPEREERLVSTGLKWSVLTTNAWTDMMEELKIYVLEKTKNGKPWDGNVPTNYKIQSNVKSDGTEIDENKNLGRWINRQRSLYQSGKLKKERETELRNIGLKWAVLSTNSWQSMYEALCKYANEKTRNGGKWDGNVPASYETPDKKKLGRWVNRQRSNYSSNKIKPDQIAKLERIGFKWFAHDKREIDERGRYIVDPTKMESPGVISHSTPTIVTSSRIMTIKPTIVSNPTIITGKSVTKVMSSLEGKPLVSRYQLPSAAKRAGTTVATVAGNRPVICLPNKTNLIKGNGIQGSYKTIVGTNAISQAYKRTGVITATQKIESKVITVGNAALKTSTNIVTATSNASIIVAGSTVVKKSITQSIVKKNGILSQPANTSENKLQVQVKNAVIPEKVPSGTNTGSKVLPTNTV